MTTTSQIQAQCSRAISVALCQKMGQDQRLRMHMIKVGASAEFCTLKDREMLPGDDKQKANKDPEVKSMFVGCRVTASLNQLKADNADILLPLDLVSRALQIHWQFGHHLGTFIAIDHSDESDGASVGFIAIKNQEQFHPFPKITTSNTQKRGDLEIFVSIPSAAIQLQKIQG